MKFEEHCSMCGNPLPCERHDSTAFHDYARRIRLLDQAIEWQQDSLRDLNGLRDQVQDRIAKLKAFRQRLMVSAAKDLTVQ